MRDTNDLFGNEVQPSFELHRADFLAAARCAALEIGRGGRAVTVNDVRAVVQPPADIDPRVMGAVFKTRDWECIGYSGSKRRVSHGRPVAQFVLRTGY